MNEATGNSAPQPPLSPEIIKDAPFRMPRTPANFSIVLGFHTEPEDISDTTAKLVQNADVVLLENVAWTSDHLHKIRGIARTGEFGRDIPPYFQKLYGVIAGTKAAYHFWDPALDTETGKLFRSYYSGGGAWTEVSSLDEYRQKLDIKCEYTTLRDTLALKEIGKKVDGLVGSDKKSSKKPKNVVILAGAMHQLLGHRIALAQDTAHAVQITEPRLDDGPTEYIKAKLAGGIVSDEALQRMLLLDLFIQNNDGSVEAQIEKVQHHIASTSQEALDHYISGYFTTVQEAREAKALKKAQSTNAAHASLARMGIGGLIGKPPTQI